ncbi:MAG: exodeoxyribonuclease VII small subunit [Sandaracinaceae bacterium]|nr:exodeoxyribonuclease VII small subunit [Sandaracinaceae bacterium]
MSPSTKRSRTDAQSPASDALASGDALRAATFEAVMEELQTVVTRLEEGELSLEESLVAFELGVKLSREGSRRLEDAERRVDALLAGDPAAPDSSSP